MRKRSKRYKELKKFSTKGKKVEIKEIFDLVKKTSTTKFDESIDVSMRINLKQSKGADFNLRTIVKLPNGSGKKYKVAVLCESEKIEEAKKSGAAIVGSDDLLEKIDKQNVFLGLVEVVNYRRRRRNRDKARPPQFIAGGI